MTTPPGDQPGGTPAGGPVVVSPLLPADPPRISRFWLDARLSAAPGGVAFAAHTEGDTPAIVIILSEGAADDAAARDRLAGMVNPMHIDHVLARGGQGQSEGRLARKYVADPDYPVAGSDKPNAPWVALSWDGGQAGVDEADHILAEVALSDLPPEGQPDGPDYRLYWVNRVKPGLARLWPLPWPGRYTRAGWVTILVSWLLMLLLAALAILIAILIFRNQSPQSPPQPTPTNQSASGGGSPSPQSGSPSPQSGSPSPQSGSPSPSSGSPSPSSGSPSPSEGNSPSSATPSQHNPTPGVGSPGSPASSGGGASPGSRL